MLTELKKNNSSLSFCNLRVETQLVLFFIFVYNVKIFVSVKLEKKMAHKYACNLNCSQNISRKPLLGT